jgi:hypothetical protein
MTKRKITRKTHQKSQSSYFEILIKPNFPKESQIKQQINWHDDLLTSPIN